MRYLKENCIIAEIICGNKNLESIYRHRSNEEVPFQMSRRQFPVKLGSAITINKSQGQSFNKVGIFLPSPVISYGQLYVALLRVTSK